MVSVLAVLVHWLKMDAQKTYVLWLNRNTQEQAFSGRRARARQVAGLLSAEMHAVLATTIRRCAPLVARVDSTWCRARRIAVRSVASSESTARTRTSNGSRASAFLPLLVNSRLTLRPSVLNGCRTKYPPASSALMACVAVPRVVA